MNEVLTTRKRVRFRFSLALLLALVTIFGIAMGFWWPLRIVRQRQATRAWIESAGGQVIYLDGEWERYGKRGRVEPGQVVEPMPLAQKLLGDTRAVLIAIPDDDTFSEGDVARIKRVFPEAGIWYDVPPTPVSR